MTSSVCSRFNLPHNIELNGIIDEELILSEINVFYRMYFKRCQLYVFNKAAGIITVAPEIKDWIIKHYHVSSDHICTISNGVNPNRFSPKSCQDSRVKYHLRDDAFIIGYLGSLFQWCGLELLIEAAPEIIKKIPNSYFLIGGGEEPLKSQLIQKVHEKGLDSFFSFGGRIPWDDANAFISTFDIAVAPINFRHSNSNLSGSPQKLFSYLSCERPVVCSDIKVLEYLLINSGTGLTFKQGNVESLINTILRLFDMKRSDREKMGKKGRELVLNKFSWESVVEKTLEFFS